MAASPASVGFQFLSNLVSCDEVILIAHILLVGSRHYYDIKFIYFWPLMIVSHMKLVSPLRDAHLSNERRLQTRDESGTRGGPLPGYVP